MTDLLAGQHAEVQSQLLQEDERENGLRSQADEGRHVTLEESQRAQLRGVSNDVPDAGELSRLGVHRSRLQHVQWLRQRRGDRTGYARSCEVGRQVVLEVAGLEHHLLHLVVERQLADGHEHGTGRGGAAAGEQAAEPFLAVHAPKAVDGVFVAKTESS